MISKRLLIQSGRRVKKIQWRNLYLITNVLHTNSNVLHASSNILHASSNVLQHGLDVYCGPEGYDSQFSTFRIFSSRRLASYEEKFKLYNFNKSYLSMPYSLIYFVVILKRPLQNYLKFFKKCFLCKGQLVCCPLRKG